MHIRPIPKQYSKNLILLFKITCITALIYIPLYALDNLITFQPYFNIERNRIAQYAGDSLENRKYDTDRLHKLTKDIQETLKAIRSIKDTLRVDKCPPLSRIDSFNRQEQDLYTLIKGWTIEDCKSINTNIPIRNCKLLTLENNIIKKETVKLEFKNNPEGAMKFFRGEMKRLEASLSKYLGEIKLALSKLRRCERRNNVCYAAIENGYSTSRIGDIKKLTKLLTLDTASLRKNEKQYQLTLKSFEDQITADRNNKNYSSDYLIDLELAIIYELKYRLSSKPDSALCSKSHLRWAGLSDYNYTTDSKSINPDHLIKDPYCELEKIQMESKNWGYGIIISKKWIEERKEATKECATHPRICPCVYGENTEQVQKESAVGDPNCRGCMDKAAINYCGYARYPGPCIYAICPDSCYSEHYVKRLYPKFDKKRDKTQDDPELCDTDICGCMDPSCSNYNKIYERDDNNDCDCGCLDSTAVNYARRVSPEWARNKYYNPNITTHVQSKCHWRGCMDLCSANYDPLAKISNDSCQCDPITREQLLARKNKLQLQIEDQPSADNIKNQFLDIIRKKKYNRDEQRVAKDFNFKRSNDNLVINGAIQADTRLKGSGSADQIGLGVYHFPPIYNVCASLIDFLYANTGDILYQHIEGKIVGEADAHPIRGDGIVFNSNGRPLGNQGFKAFHNTDNTSIDAMIQDNFPIAPNKMFGLSDGNRIEENIVLAFARAALVKQNLLLGAPSIPGEKILIGAKHNIYKGGDYRKISVVFIVHDFFKYNKENEYDLTKERDNIVAAMKFFDRKGYPRKNKYYEKCPCLRKTTE